MDEILSEQEAILEEFREMGDSFGCYSYLLALAGLLPPCPEEMKTPENAVKGCQSHVWLRSWAEDGRFRFQADSDTYILKGLLYLLMNVLDGRPLEAAAKAELYFWKDPMLLGSFDDQRQKGVGYVAAALRKSAGELLKNDPAGGSLAE
jgi:SufE protein probably involved in Fe-S center assembly